MASEVFATSWRRRQEPKEKSDRAWAFGVARRVVLNEWRSRRRRKRLSDKVRGVRGRQGPEPEMIVVRRAQDERVVTALQRLGKKDQEVLMLSEWDSLSPTEISQVLGISLPATHQRLSRARKRLARVVELTDPGLVQEFAPERGNA